MTSPTQSAMEQQQREEPMQTEREAFEAWAKREGWHDFSRNERHPIYYEQSGLQSSWAAWQAQASELRSLRDSLALARSRIAELEGEPKATPTDAQIRVFAEEMGMWVEPHEAERESGVEVECSISREEAERHNAEFIATIREAWARAFGAPLSARAALNKEQP